jgi:phage terminase large subunit
MLDRVNVWPPNYAKVFAWRTEQKEKLRDPEYAACARAFYKNHRIDFIEHWGITFDPRNVGTPLPTILPFVLFPRQRELVQFLEECVRDGESGLIEKSRDMGATWLCCAFSVHLWLFEPGSASGWGSLKSDLVDRRNVMDSIFEKLRQFIIWLPRGLKPVGFEPDVHMAHMRIFNPENGATIAGEGGDEIGRGGRTTIYFKDEAAHYERPEQIEAALSNNTRVQIDLSSVCGLGNVFHRRREAGVDWSPGVRLPAGKTRVFVFDWSDHPAKTREWYNREKKKKVDEGLAHIWAQEVDRNYGASVVGVLIPPEWVVSSFDAHEVLHFTDDGAYCAALDVADEGGDTNALSVRKGVILRSLEEWGEGDTGVTTRRALAAMRACEPYVELQYDSIGPGAGIKAEWNRISGEGRAPRFVRLTPWNAGGEVLHPERHVIPGDRSSPKNEDFYHNLNAQAAWMLRRRFENTHRARTEGIRFDPDDLISIDSRIPLLRKLQKELSQPTVGYSGKMKMLINKKPDGTKSPNLFDSVKMNYWPLPPKGPLRFTRNVLERI